MRAFWCLACIGIVSTLSLMARPGSSELVDEVDEPGSIIGLWSSVDAPTDDNSPVAFYYFHSDNHIGLYRYGKLGLNTTNSYDWQLSSNVVTLTYRKTGIKQQLPVRIEGSGNNRVLIVSQDPRQLGAEGRYRFVPASMTASMIGSDDVMTISAGPGGRMWIHDEQFATGGRQFALYQLRPAGIDGRGTGWFHVGDFDDWSTEAMTYRITQEGWDLAFAVRGERAQTAVRTDNSGADKALVLLQDPRGFWAPRRYVDGGPSFGVQP